MSDASKAELLKNDPRQVSQGGRRIQIPEPKQPRTAILKHVADYYDNRGIHVSEREVVWGAAPEGFTRFIGRASLTRHHPLTGQPFAVEMEFPIPAETVAEAFDNFHDALTKEAPARVAELDKKDDEIRKQMMLQPARVPGVLDPKTLR